MRLIRLRLSLGSVQNIEQIGIGVSSDILGRAKGVPFLKLCGRSALFARENRGALGQHVSTFRPRHLIIICFIGKLGDSSQKPALPKAKKIQLIEFIQVLVRRVASTPLERDPCSGWLYVALGIRSERSCRLELDPREFVTRSFL
jgi:hypothetical protein